MATRRRRTKQSSQTTAKHFVNSDEQSSDDGHVFIKSSNKQTIEQSNNQPFELLELVQDPAQDTYKQVSRYQLKDNQIIKQSNKQSNKQPINQTFYQSIKHSIASTIISVFLPVNYPHSVTRDYLAYQVCDTLQGLTSYLRSLICMNSLMAGMGVGSVEKTTVNATLMWVTRDGCGLFGSLLFGYWFSDRFGQNVKRFRLFADIINDVGLFLELISPMFEGYFLLFACLGTICRALCGVSAGATRGAILSHFARANNAADLNAKEGMQETAVTLMGMTMGWGVLKMIDSNEQSKEQSHNQFVVTWVIFIVLTIVHVWANVVAMNSLIFTSLDRTRSQLLMEDFINQTIKQSNKQSKIIASVMTPEQLNQKQWIMPLPSLNLFRNATSTHVELGCRITDVDPKILQIMIRLSAKQTLPFLLVPSFLPGNANKQPKIFVLLKNNPSTNQSITQLQPILATALFHAVLLASKYPSNNQPADQSIESIYTDCLIEGESSLSSFLASLGERGWDTNRWTIPCGKYRYQW